MLSKLKIIFYLVLTTFILYNIYLFSFFALKGEMHLTNDIGRDFLLLQELDQKKIVLIGERANVQGVFHGPLWTYMNYPAYLIGHGNPVIVAWFWVILGIIFLLTTFFMFRKLFDTSVALLALALLAADLVPHINSIFSGEAMFFFMPFFLFTIYRYIQSKKAYFLALHFITVGIFMHLNIGVGILFAMLSISLSLAFIIKNKLWKHLLSLLVLPLFLSNFILFDLRHEFNMTKALLHVGGGLKFYVPFNYWMQNRIESTVSLQILSNNIFSHAFINFLLIVIFTFLSIKNKTKYKNFFLILVFYYFGYMMLSYFNKGLILSHYIFVLIPLSAIWLAALVKGSYKMIFIPVILIVIYLNFNYAKGYLSGSQGSFMGKSPDSWISLKTVAKNIINEQNGKEFGYYVYSPDSYAYQQRYAMTYSFKDANAKAFEYVKKPITYVIAAPHPIDNPYMGHEWWIKNEAKISSLPVQTSNFASGYVVEKFNLTPSEQKIAHDPNIELGLHFR